MTETASAGGIQPLDLIRIQAVGTLMDQPINGIYLVEPSGQVTLGPSYGRVAVKGLSLLAAEAAITKQLKTVLTRPEVQVTAAGHATHWRSGQPPTAPYHIHPGDLLQIQAYGTLIDQPIDDNYTVEASGTVPLGPVYGRVNVNGLTLAEAKAAIVKHLREILRKPEVSVTLAGWKSDEQLKADVEAAAAKHDRELKEYEQRRKAKKDRENRD